MGDVAAAEPDVVVAALRRAGKTVAVAESLTSGLVTAALTSVPGASVVVRGGVVAYATDLKATLAAVPYDILDRDGPVARSTAAAMARGVRTVCDAAYGVATTGVAGPESQGGHPPGTVYVAVASGSTVRVRSARSDGDVGNRDAVRRRAVGMALALLVEVIEDDARHIRES
jgi:nicotinamide-nucleotide amidase